MDKILSRRLAIKIIDRAMDMQGGFDDWWPDMMDEFGLYDEENDTCPSFYAVLAALGISKKEYEDAGVT